MAGSTTSAGVVTSYLLRPMADPYRSRTWSWASVMSRLGGRIVVSVLCSVAIRARTASYRAPRCGSGSKRRPTVTRRATASLTESYAPLPTPARMAAPKVPGSSWATTSTGIPVRSAMSWSHQVGPRAAAGRPDDAGLDARDAPGAPSDSEKRMAMPSSSARTRSTDVVARVTPPNVPPKPAVAGSCGRGVKEASANTWPGSRPAAARPASRSVDGQPQQLARPVHDAHAVGIGGQDAEAGGTRDAG